MEDKQKFVRLMKQKNHSEKTMQDYLREYYVLRKLIDEHGLKEAVAIYVSDKHNTMHRSFVNNYLESIEVYDIKIPKVTGIKPHVEKQHLTREEEIDLKDGLYLVSDRNGLLFEISLECGLRRNEALGIKRKDFRFSEWRKDESKELLLHLKKETTKFKKERLVPISPRLAYKIAKYINYYKIEPDQRLFKITPKYWNRLLNKYSRAILGRPINPHLLRHTQATRLDDKGAKIQDVQKWLGHSSITTTEGYIKRDEKKALKNIGKLLRE